MKYDILENAQKLQQRMEEYTSYLQSNPESGFELEKTYNYVFGRLTELGLSPKKCGRCGIYADIDGKSGGKTFLLRADMDALKGIDGEDRERVIHACGHHFHTAMLLGAAELLIKNKKSFTGKVRLMFQPAEEILEGAKDMIENRVLDFPQIDGAMMIHVLSGVDMPCGTVVVSAGGISAPAADFFRINVKGRGTHGALSHQGVDALMASCYIITALNEIKARELAIDEQAAITVGKVEGANVANVIPDNICLEGSLRSFGENTRERIRQRVCDICKYTAIAFRSQADVSFISGCPALQNDHKLSDIAFKKLGEIFGDGMVIRSDGGKGTGISGGSEDFSYISNLVPSIMIAVCAGNKAEGYTEPLHHPKVRFDKRALSVGAAAYAYMAQSFLTGI